MSVLPPHELLDDGQGGNGREQLHQVQLELPLIWEGSDFPLDDAIYFAMFLSEVVAVEGMGQ